jgi:hypothetical protein
MLAFLKTFLEGPHLFFLLIYRTNPCSVSEVARYTFVLCCSLLWRTQLSSSITKTSFKLAFFKTFLVGHSNFSIDLER